MTDTAPQTARMVDLGSQSRTEKSAYAIVPRDLTRGGLVLTVGVQILEPTVLDAYQRRRLISTRQFDAGCHLAKLFHAAIHLPAVTASYGAPRGSGGGVDSGVDARRLLWSTLVHAGLAVAVEGNVPFVVTRRASVDREQVRGPIVLNGAGNIAIAVCGYDEWAGGTRRLETLRRGLDGLADLWQIADRSRPTRSRPRSTMAPDARPSDQPEARDLAWAAEQNARRRRKLGLDEDASET